MYLMCMYRFACRGARGDARGQLSVPPHLLRGPWMEFRSLALMMTLLSNVLFYWPKAPFCYR